MKETTTVRGHSLRFWAVLFLITLFLGGGAPVFGQQKHNSAVKNQGAAVLKDQGVATVKEHRKAPRKNRRSRWGKNYFPNVPLITHEGKSVRFFDDLLKGKVVMLNFIYTTCPDVCSVETARLVRVQEILGDRVGKDIFMYSITIDPANDTPQVLRQYAEKFGVGPGWTFLTGNEADVVLLRRKMGLYIEDIDKDGNTNNHNVSLIIGNQSTGQWMKRSPFDDPYFLAAQVGSWLSNWRRPDAVNQNSYADAPKLRNTSTGENLFRTRCSSCHTIGARDTIKASQRPMGPDLLGVTHKRGRAWLSRWLAEPDKMLAEKDPVAMDLYAEYNNMPMPNLGLNAIEVDALIDFMDIESRRIENSQQKTVRSN